MLQSEAQTTTGTNTLYEGSDLSLGSQTRLPEYHRAKLKLWNYLNPSNLDSLLACFDIDDYDEFLSQLNPREAKNIRKFAEINPATLDRSDQFKCFSRLISFILKLNAADKKDRILIEVYYYLIKFGLFHSFEKEKISALILIFKQVYFSWILGFTVRLEIRNYHFILK